MKLHVEAACLCWACLLLGLERRFDLLSAVPACLMLSDLYCISGAEDAEDAKQEDAEDAMKERAIQQYRYGLKLSYIPFIVCISDTIVGLGSGMLPPAVHMSGSTAVHLAQLCGTTSHPCHASSPPHNDSSAMCCHTDSPHAQSGSHASTDPAGPADLACVAQA